MVSLSQAVMKAEALGQLVVKVVYFNNSVEYYVHQSMPDKNEYIPDGYQGKIVLVEDFSQEFAF